MKANQLTQGQDRRVMYLENKDGLLEGSRARIGIKKRGSNTHLHESTSVVIDDDARDEYQRLRQGA